MPRYAKCQILKWLNIKFIFLMSIFCSFVGNVLAIVIQYNDVGLRIARSIKSLYLWIATNGLKTETKLMSQARFLPLVELFQIMIKCIVDP